MRLRTLALLLIASCGSGIAPCAAQPAVPLLQDAVIKARNGTLSITRLPIRTAEGIIYRDVTIELQVDDSGNVTLNTDKSGPASVQGASVKGSSVKGGPVAKILILSAPVRLSQHPSAPLVLQHFTPGTYEAPGSPLVKLSARGAETAHGLPGWSLTTIGDADGPIERASWFSGPADLNPLARRLEQAGIESGDFAYGTAASGNTELFGGGALIGVSQQGRTLKVVSFRQGCCSARDTPTATLVFTRVGQ